MNLLFLDTETTGKGLSDRIVQIAYKFGHIGGPPTVEYFLPPVPITYGAMAVHHITNDMVANKPVFDGSETQKFLNNLVLKVIMVAHNAPFDLKMLEREQVRFPIWIDTLRVARHLIEAESHSLQYLRYFLDLRVEGTAHNAEGDVNVLIALFEKLMSILLTNNPHQTQTQAIDRMVTLSNLPVNIRKVPYGKYQGRTFEEIAGFDRQYLVWMYGQEKKKIESEQNTDLIFTLKHHLEPVQQEKLLNV